MNSQAESLIKKGPLQMALPASRTYCTFRLQGALFGIDALAVKEITVVPPLTPIPHAPGAVRGYVNLRGQIVLVLDPNRLLHHGESTIGIDTRLMVFRAHLGDPFGILVDRIGDIVELSDERIEHRNSGAFSTEDNGGSPPTEILLAGIGKLDAELLAILDPGKLLPHIDSAIAQNRKTADA